MGSLLAVPCSEVTSHIHALLSKRIPFKESSIFGPYCNWQTSSQSHGRILGQVCLHPGPPKHKKHDRERPRGAKSSFLLPKRTYFFSQNEKTCNNVFKPPKLLETHTGVPSAAPPAILNPNFEGAKVSETHAGASLALGQPNPKPQLFGCFGALWAPKKDPGRHATVHLFLILQVSDTWTTIQVVEKE